MLATGPELRKLLTPVAPGAGKDFSVDAMINEICASEEMDLRGLDNVFQATIDKLAAQRDVVSAKIAELEKSNAKAAAKYHENLREPEKLLSLICAEMDELEDRFTKVSSSAVVIGDRLAVIDKEKSRVLETNELLEVVQLLNAPSGSTKKTTNKLFNTLKDPLQIHEACRVIKKLQEFAEELTPSPATQGAVSEIDRLTQSIETDLLNGFSDAQEQELRGVGNTQDFETMQQNVRSLLAYNGKDKVADRYVWNIMKERLTKNQLALESVDPAKDMDSLFTKLRAICKQQFAVVPRIFPATAVAFIRETLVERLYHDPAFGVLSQLERLLGSPSISPIEYVMTLTWAFEKTEKLTEAIAALVDDPAQRPRMDAFLETQLQTLFGAHRLKYVAIEVQLLEAAYATTMQLVAFPSVPVGKHAKSKLKAETAPPSPSSGAVSKPEKAALKADKTDPVTVYYDALLPIAGDTKIPHRFVHDLTAASARCDVVLHKSDLRVDVYSKLFALYCDSFGDEYLSKLCNLAHELVQEPLLCMDSATRFFVVLKHLIEHVAYFDKLYRTTIAPALAAAPTAQTVCVEGKRSTLERLEGLVAFGLQKTFLAIEKSLVAILTATQDKSDFLSKTGAMSLTSTKACKQVVAYLTPLLRVAAEALVDCNRVQFVTGLTAIFKDTLIQHMKRFKFDPDGACMLLTDISAYRQVFSPYRNPSVDANFDFLHSLANLYALPRDSLVSYVTEGGIAAALGKTSLHELIRRRWDYKLNGEKIPI
ncbi:exocyst complex component [Achlya hypogyna]|uniref:Exocyst complex component n=1 Tax=Achlya hypogyna TaxID=1202772 RepID=A0A1V9ZAN1_ACHHY|nr:exocyst complex component [Achlya hypogyna]